MGAFIERTLVADYELTDQDRAELIKNFFQRYGSFIVVALLLLVLGLGINNWWQKHQYTRASTASNAYQALLTSMQNGTSPDVIKAAATEISVNYSGTVYASLAQLQLAGIAVAQANLSTAESLLKNDLAQNSHNALKPIISLRLARLWLAENKSQATLDLLKHPPKGYEAAYGLLAGDAYIQLKNLAQAQLSYQQALSAAHNDPVLVQLLTERLNSLGVN
jgi:predicted negative regulator of RcsB-dependent stress response